MDLILYYGQKNKIRICYLIIATILQPNKSTQSTPNEL